MPRASTAVALASGVAGFDSTAAAVFAPVGFVADVDAGFDAGFDADFDAGFTEVGSELFVPVFDAASARVGTLGSRDDVRAETSRATSSLAPLLTPFDAAPVAFSPFELDLETPLETLLEPATEPLTLRDDPRAGVSFAIGGAG